MDTVIQAHSAECVWQEANRATEKWAGVMRLSNRSGVYLAAAAGIH